MLDNNLNFLYVYGVLEIERDCIFFVFLIEYILFFGKVIRVRFFKLDIIKGEIVKNKFFISILVYLVVFESLNFVEGEG